MVGTIRRSILRNSFFSSADPGTYLIVSASWNTLVKLTERQVLPSDPHVLVVLLHLATLDYASAPLPRWSLLIFSKLACFDIIFLEPMKRKDSLARSS